MTDFEREFDEFIDGRFYAEEISQVRREIMRAVAKYLLPVWADHYDPQRLKEDAEFLSSCLVKGPDYKEEYSWKLDGYNVPHEESKIFGLRNIETMVWFPGERGHDEADVQEYGMFGGPVFYLKFPSHDEHVRSVDRVLDYCTCKLPAIYASASGHFVCRVCLKEVSKERFEIEMKDLERTQSAFQEKAKNANDDLAL